MEDNDEEIFIIGIGASAGGLEAIRTLLHSSPKDAPAAYVVVQHMAPKQRSMLTPLIDRETHLKTQELLDPVRPQRNHVYVGPPGSDIIYDGGMLKLVPPSEKIAVPKPSVDRFFRSLADEVAERSIGIVLSGTGSDGSAGVKAIREAGGITFAQDDQSAKYDGMPNSAIETGCIDLILSPIEIGQRLETLSLTMPRLAEVMKAEADQAPLTEILLIVLAKTQVDFRDYKPTTILRRLERRMTAIGINSQAEYAAHLRENSDEIDALFRDFLISVTRFFRDPVQFEALEPFLEDLVGQTGDRRLRVWITGCATGEEVYSIAMLLAEAMGGLQVLRKRGLQILATDIDQKALNIARTGRYPLGVLADVPARFIKPFFEIKDDFVEIIPELKKTVLFSVHNVVQDPPFKDIDLICCRNLLIYFNPVLQTQTFNNFHYALQEQGLVFLGTADNSIMSEDLFIEADGNCKVLKKRETGKVNYAERTRRLPLLKPRIMAVEPTLPQVTSMGSDTTINALVKGLASSLGKAAILMTRDLGIAHVFGDITPYVSLKEGKVRSELDHNVLTDPLGAEVRVLSTMVDPKAPVRRGFKRQLAGRDDEQIQLEMIYLSHPDMREDMYLLVFNHIENDDVAPSLAQNEPETVQRLRDELTMTRDALQQTIERWETANEELKTANEELQSNNEELQSMNEELETANEELQSTNEELVTLNEANQVQADEWNELNEEQEAVLSQIEAPLVIFDLNLAVSKVSRSAVRLFQTGLPLGKPHISQLALPEGFPPLAPICDKALRLGQVETLNFRTDDSIWHLVCSPFANKRGEIQGGTLFVTASDVALEELKSLNQQLEDQNKQVKTVNDELRAFAYAAAHGLKSPLNTLDLLYKVLAEQAQDQQQDSDVDDVLHSIDSTLNRMHKFIAGSLDYSKAMDSVAYGHVVDLDAMLQEIVQDLDADIQAASATFHMDRLGHVRGNTIQLRMLLQNLVSNALKYRKPVIPLQIEIRNTGTEPVSDGVQDFVSFAVMDNGIGIDPAFTGKVFGFAERLHNQADIPGAGLGLSVCKRIAANHGGSIAFDRTTTNGARICVSLGTSVEASAD